MKMKLEAELSGVIEKMKEIEEKIKLHAEHLKKTGGYKDFETRLAWDALRAAVGSNTISKIMTVMTGISIHLQNER